MSSEILVRDGHIFDNNHEHNRHHPHDLSSAFTQLMILWRTLELALTVDSCTTKYCLRNISWDGHVFDNNHGHNHHHPHGLSTAHI